MKLGLLILQPIQGRFKLIKDFKVEGLNPGNFHKEDLTIPKGYCTNGADVPRALWSFFPPFNPKYLHAVVVHDYLCTKSQEKQGLKAKNKAFQQANKIFKQVLEHFKVHPFKIKLMVAGIEAWRLYQYHVKAPLNTFYKRFKSNIKGER